MSVFTQLSKLPKKIIYGDRMEITAQWPITNLATVAVRSAGAAAHLGGDTTETN